MRFMQQWFLALYHFYKPKICLEIAEDNLRRLNLSAQLYSSMHQHT